MKGVPALSLSLGHLHTILQQQPRLVGTTVPGGVVVDIMVVDMKVNMEVNMEVNVEVNMVASLVYGY